MGLQAQFQLVDGPGEDLDSDGGDFWAYGWLFDAVPVNIFLFKENVS